MKRLHCAILCIFVLVISLLATPLLPTAFADEEYPETPIEEEPYAGLSDFYPYLSFRNGKAVCGASINVLDGYSGSLIVELKENGQVIKTWTYSVCGEHIYHHSEQYPAVRGSAYQVVISAVLRKNGVSVQNPPSSTPVYIY